MADLTLNGAAPLIRHDGYKIQVSNNDGDDFLRRQIKILATRPDGRSLYWTLPDRLLRRADVAAVVVSELCEELGGL